MRKEGLHGYMRNEYDDYVQQEWSNETMAKMYAGVIFIICDRTSACVFEVYCT